MGVGDSLEASFVLIAPLKQGVCGLIGDGILAGEGVTELVVRFEVLLRKGGSEAILCGFENRFVRNLNDRFAAIRYMAEAPFAEPVVGSSQVGDQLVLRVRGLAGSAGGSLILNGEGARSGGRIPRILLPS